jgi:hypothetical protein
MTGAASQLAGQISPIRVAQRYQPLGQQLFVHPHIVRARDAHSAQFEAVAAAVAAAPSTTGIGSSGGVDAMGLMDDDDNVDIAAAFGSTDTDGTTSSTSTTTMTLPQPQVQIRRSIAMHRMASYRNRLMNICIESLNSLPAPHYFPFLPPLEHLAAVNTPRVVATELLAPAMFPLTATAVVPPAFSHHAAHRHHQHTPTVDADKQQVPVNKAIQGKKGLPIPSRESSTQQHQHHVEQYRETKRHVESSWFPWKLFRPPKFSSDDSMVEVSGL